MRAMLRERRQDWRATDRPCNRALFIDHQGQRIVSMATPQSIDRPFDSLLYAAANPLPRAASVPSSLSISGADLEFMVFTVSRTDSRSS